MEAGAGALFSWAPPPPVVNLFNLLHYHGLLLLDKETKQKLANLGRDYGDRFLAADGFAQTHPEHKYLIVEGLCELGYRVGMTGNGVNDSPALKVVLIRQLVRRYAEAATTLADTTAAIQ